MYLYMSYLEYTDRQKVIELLNKLPRHVITKIHTEGIKGVAYEFSIAKDELPSLDQLKQFLIVNKNRLGLKES